MAAGSTTPVDVEITTTVSKPTPKPTKVECDRCGGKHPSEECPYFKKPRDPPPGYNSDGTKSEWAIKREYEENRQEFWKRCTRLTCFIFGMCALILMSFYLFYVAVGCGRISKISKTDEYESCVDGDALNVAVPSDMEMLFVLVMGLFIALIAVLDLVLRICDKCIPKSFWECIFKSAKIIVVIILVAVIVDIAIVTHIFMYYQEVDDEFGDCLQPIDDPFEWDHSYAMLSDSFIIQWFALLCTVVTVVSWHFYSTNDAILI